MNIAASEFVKRQTANSPFSHYNGPWQDVVNLVEKHWENQTHGYRDGVVLVLVPVDHFFSGVCELNEGDALGGIYKARQEGETPRKTTWKVGGKKMPAQYVEIILYSHGVLAENHEQSSDADWEILSVNASPEPHPMPQMSGSLIANHLGLSGGTDTKMSDEEFVQSLKKSIEFWQDKILAEPKPSHL